MSSNSSTNHKRRNTLELKGDQTVATDEQIRRHKPELFDTSHYLKQIQEALKPFTQLSSRNPIVSRLDEESQKRLDDYLSHLLMTIQCQLTQIPFEFDVQQAPSDCEEEDPVTREHKITATVKNSGELLASIAQPLQELEKLHNLSSLVAQMQSYIERLKGSLPNFREHSRRHEVEIEALKGELRDLEEQEKGGGLNRAEKIQKEQLEKEIGEHRQDIARNSKKLNKRKKQISHQQKNIDQIIQTLTQFLNEFDSQNSEFLPENLDPNRFTADNIQFATLSIKPDLQRILREKREGQYTAYHSSIERGRTMLVWAKRASLAVLLAAIGSGAYYLTQKFDPDNWKPAKITHPLFSDLDKESQERLLSAETVGELKADFDHVVKKSGNFDHDEFYDKFAPFPSTVSLNSNVAGTRARVRYTVEPLLDIVKARYGPNVEIYSRYNDKVWYYGTPEESIFEIEMDELCNSNSKHGLFISVPLIDDLNVNFFRDTNFLEYDPDAFSELCPEDLIIRTILGKSFLDRKWKGSSASRMVFQRRMEDYSKAIRSNPSSELNQAKLEVLDSYFAKFLNLSETYAVTMTGSIEDLEDYLQQIREVKMMKKGEFRQRLIAAGSKGPVFLVTPRVNADGTKSFEVTFHPQFTEKLVEIFGAGMQMASNFPIDLLDEETGQIIVPEARFCDHNGSMGAGAKFTIPVIDSVQSVKYPFFFLRHSDKPKEELCPELPDQEMGSVQVRFKLK